MKNRKGDILLSVIVFAAVATTVIVGLASWGAAMLRSIRNVATREQAFQIAEAGVDYYRWHLAQFPTDYTDSTTTPGPYYHNFYDKDGDLVGSYALSITAPPLGSTKVVITSTATTTADPKVVRVIQATLAEPSLAQYAAIAQDVMRFGAGTTVYGPISSNSGIHFDGLAYNVVSSALATYTDPDVGLTEWGVYTTSGTDDPRPPTPANNRPDVFTAGRQYPTPGFPFASLTVNLSNLLSIAAPGGVCNAPACWSPSNAQGYYMHMNNNNTYDMYKVTALYAAPNNCTNDNGQTQWGTWSISTLGSLVGTYAIPASGVIFVEDHLWIDGQVTNTRVTVAAAANIGDTDPSTYTNITINDNLLYSSLDGSSIIGLIAQGNINVGLASADNLTIDAALLSEKGRVGRFYYNSHCKLNGIDYHDRSSLTLNGMIATAIRYGFAYTDGTGYDIRNINYDANLLYSPPPSFPLASTQYQMVSWRELQ